MDFSKNPYADGKFRFTDKTLLDEISLGNKVMITMATDATDANNLMNQSCLETEKLNLKKVIRVCVGFYYVPLLVIKLAPFSQTIGSKTKTNLTCSHAFSHAWCPFHLFTSSCDWFIVLFGSVMITLVSIFPRLVPVARIYIEL